MSTQPTQIPNDGHIITYKMTDLSTFQTIAELPLQGMQYALVVDGAGDWSATLSVEDPYIAQTNWIRATAPNKSALWIDIDGALVYGGIVTGRNYRMSSQSVTLRGHDFYGYMSQRLQAKDYTSTWATSPGAAAGDIANTVMTDSLAVPFSIPITVVPVATAAPSTLFVTLTAPLTQQQTVDSIVAQLQQLGYGVGIDFACDPTYVAGLPAPVVTLSYPRRGRPAGVSGLVVDLSGAIDLEYDEDGSSMSNGIVEQLGAAGGVVNESQWAASMTTDGYPLYEQVVSHASFSPSGLPAPVQTAFVAGDLAKFAYPLTVPVVTVPLFGNPNFNTYIAGDDVLLYVPTGAGQVPTNNPRFPNGLYYYFRIIRVDVTIPDQGMPYAALTLNIPPNTVPQTPPT